MPIQRPVFTQVERVTDQNPLLQVLDADRRSGGRTPRQISQLLYLIYGMLGMSISRSSLALGVEINTMALSVLERTREDRPAAAVGLSATSAAHDSGGEAVLVAVSRGRGRRSRRP